MKVIWSLALVLGGAFAALPLAASAADAPAAFTKNCVTCHIVGKNAIGPNLVGVFGRKAGAVADFKYSDPHLKSGLTWDEPTLTKYLADPKSMIPGNKMIFVGLKNPDEVKDVIAYLKSLK